MRTVIILLIGIGILATIVFAKTEDGTSIAKPVSLYGTTASGSLVPLLVGSDGTLQIQ